MCGVGWASAHHGLGMGCTAGASRPTRYDDVIMTFDIPDDVYREIEAQIASDDSPVGIDAKKTHIVILHKLLEIERRLERLEAGV